MYFGGSQVFLQDANSLIAKTSELRRSSLPARKTPFHPTDYQLRPGQDAGEKIRGRTEGTSAAGLSRIHIGMETGYDPLLQYMKKGVTAKEQIQGGRNVVESGISLSEYVMPGLGGKRWWREHAVETARVLNQIDPDFIRLRTLYVRKNMPLFSKVESGEFIRLSDDEVVSEIRLFIATLDGIHSTVISDHILNLLEEVQGKLPEDKEKMIGVIDRYLALPEEEAPAIPRGPKAGVLPSLVDLQDLPLWARIGKIIEKVGHSRSQEETLSPKRSKEKFTA